MARKAFRGDLVWTEKPGEFRFLEDGFLVISDNVIESVSKRAPDDAEILDFRGRIIIPGLYDIHMHAPQYMFAGLYMDEELLTWLDHHTFPSEARFSDISFAEKAYGRFVEDLKNSVTARASIFGTIHTDSTLLLMSLLEEAGLPCFVGKVSMDRNSPPDLSEDTEKAVREELRFLNEASGFTLEKPIVTPRFIPSCTDELMRSLSDIAREGNLPVQSHLDENQSEVEWVKKLCPWSRSYADAYDRLGLLSGKTIMAHCVWVNDEEMELLKERGAWVAHSPSSNMNLSSGVAPVRKFLDMGMNTGLATDVAGGSSLSLFRMMTDAITSSKLRWRLQDSSLRPLVFSEAFYLASRGGGSFFGKMGTLEPGFAADVLVLEDTSASPVLHDELSLPERLEYYAYRTPERRPVAKFVGGRRII